MAWHTAGILREPGYRQRRRPHRDVAPRSRWLVDARKGRSQQLLSPREKGRETFEAATRHIYDPPPSDWTGRFELLLIGNGEDRDVSAGEARRNAGFGSPLPGVWVAPSGVPVPDEAAGAIRLEVSAEDDSGRRLLSASWPLDHTAGAYLKFTKTFEPLRAALARGTDLSEADAFTARILLIHHYRRVVLRDPLLPENLLPADWPGRAARALRRYLSRTACLSRPNNGLMAMEPTRRARCRRQGSFWNGGSRPDFMLQKYLA